MSADPSERWLDLATAIAAAADFACQSEVDRRTVMQKADESTLTSTDLCIQRMACERIREEFPGHAVVCEEEGDYLSAIPAPSGARLCWVVDPLDGTRNWVRGLPCFATSIALLDKGTPVVGVVRNHAGGVTYAARRGHGAVAGKRPMCVSNVPFGRQSVVTFQPARDGSTYEAAVAWLGGVHVRNFGSTALHLALVASGSVDGALAVECRMWDIAAGALLIEEAGGRITGPAGESLVPFDLEAPTSRFTPFVAGNPTVHAAVLAASGAT